MAPIQHGTAAADRSLLGKTVVMTGATSGLGAAAAGELARKGARMVLIARDPARGERTLAAMARHNPGADHRLHVADLSLLEEMKRVAAEVARAESRIDVLVNNAGAIFGAPSLTRDGLERTFAINHMAYFVLTLGLRDALAATPGARVVSTASAAHRAARFDPVDPQSLHRYTALRAYGRSKLYNILFTRELARRWAPLGITANCHHPGVVATRFGDAGGGWLAPVVKVVKLFAITPEKGARTLVYLASSPEVAGTTGAYFDACRAIRPKPAGEDDQAAAALWGESLSLAGLPPDPPAAR